MVVMEAVSQGRSEQQKWPIKQNPTPTVMHATSKTVAMLQGPLGILGDISQDASSIGRRKMDSGVKTRVSSERHQHDKEQGR